MEFSAIICSYQGYQVPKIVLSSRVCFSNNSLNQTSVPYTKKNNKRSELASPPNLSRAKNLRPQSIASMVFMMNASGDIASGEALGFPIFWTSVSGSDLPMVLPSRLYHMLYRPPKFAKHFIDFLWDISQCVRIFVPSFWRLSSTIAWWWLVVEEIFQWWYPNFVWGGVTSSWLFV